MNKPATFQLEDYFVNKVRLDFETKNAHKIEVNLIPKGTFDSKNSKYNLTLELSLTDSENNNNELVFINCIGTFIFEDLSKGIPDFFYINSIAILFPYLRAFLSTVTTQAGIDPLVLPTYNLSALETPLRNNTTNV